VTLGMQKGGGDVSKASAGGGMAIGGKDVYVELVAELGVEDAAGHLGVHAPPSHAAPFAQDASPKR
jgi:hypothetical protein